MRGPCWAARACPAAAVRAPQRALPVQPWRRRRRRLAVLAGELPVVDWTRSQVQQCLFIDRCGGLPHVVFQAAS